MQFSFAAVNYKDKDLINRVRQDADKKFSGNSYVKNLWILKEYKKRGGKVSYKGDKPSSKKIEKQVKNRAEDKKKRILYSKEAVPNRSVNESQIKFSNVLEEEIKKMKDMVNYNKKTQ